MFIPGNANEIIETIENAQGRVLTEDEQAEIDLWSKGCELRGVVNTRAWVLIIDMLEQYVFGAQRQLIGTSPGDERVVPAHAAASALTDQLNKFKEDVASAVQAADSYPTSLLAVLRPQK